VAGKVVGGFKAHGFEKSSSGYFRFAGETEDIQ